MLRFGAFQKLDCFGVMSQQVMGDPCEQKAPAGGRVFVELGAGQSPSTSAGEPASKSDESCWSDSGLRWCVGSCARSSAARLSESAAVSAIGKLRRYCNRHPRRTLESNPVGDVDRHKPGVRW